VDLSPHQISKSIAVQSPICNILVGKGIAPRLRDRCQPQVSLGIGL
jgi:hypothetical protein